MYIIESEWASNRYPDVTFRVFRNTDQEQTKAFGYLKASGNAYMQPSHLGYFADLLGTIKWVS